MDSETISAIRDIEKQLKTHHLSNSQPITPPERVWWLLSIIRDMNAELTELRNFKAEHKGNMK